MVKYFFASHCISSRSSVRLGAVDNLTRHVLSCLENCNTATRERHADSAVKKEKKERKKENKSKGERDREVRQGHYSPTTTRSRHKCDVHLEACLTCLTCQPSQLWPLDACCFVCKYLDIAEKPRSIDIDSQSDTRRTSSTSGRR